MEATPIKAMAANQRVMIGPNTTPTRAVPRDCTANSAISRPIETISTSGVWKWAPTPGTDLSPSTADRTEMAGVMMPSP